MKKRISQLNFGGIGEDFVWVERVGLKLVTGEIFLPNIVGSARFRC